MTILPNHTVSIDDIGFFAENPDIPEPFQRKKYDMVEIDNGPPRHYQTGTQLRTLNFTTTITDIKPPNPPQLTPEELIEYAQLASPNTTGYKYTLEEVLSMLEKCTGIHLFTSRYIGSFQALITLKINGFTPDSLKANFTVEEINTIENKKEENDKGE